jgi:L-ascorbate metabolism protein UlaG (beta-lactamase superfamily)
MSAIKVTWLGHAAFEVVSPGGTKLLIDPFLTRNPATPPAFKDLGRYRPDAILVSHSHFDHAGDAMDIARATGAPVIGTFDYISGLGLPEKQALGGNVGGAIPVGDVKVHFVPAMHSSSPGGRPVGFVVALSDGRSIYHTGDTWIFSDMALIQEIHRPSIILLNVGGGPYTQDPGTGALAIRKYFNPEAIVPMHFATFPVLATEADVRAAFKEDRRLAVLQPGVTRDF